MSFQWIVDKAESISINRKKMVAQTTARDGSVKAVSRGTQPLVFTVKLPDGLPWDTNKTNIENAEALDRYQTGTISISDAGMAWYYGGTMPGSPTTYTVICTSFPEWTIFARNQVSWSGPFVFTQVVS